MPVTSVTKRCPQCGKIARHEFKPWPYLTVSVMCVDCTARIERKGGTTND